MKTFIRIDASGRVIPGSIIKTKKKPTIGRWKEIQQNICCNPVIGDFLLLEDSQPNDNNYLLQEDGSKIIL